MKALIALSVVVSLAMSGMAQTLTRAEYFFDADPGTGNATALAITPGATANQTFNVSTTSLTPGFHTVNTRVRSNAGVWSFFVSRTFFIVPPSVTVPPSTLITKAEFFFDSDPGIGNATPVSVTSNASVNFFITVPVNSLSPGFHSLNVRAKDNRNRWTLFGQRTFYIVPPVNNVGATTITKAEYFFDTDPGAGNAITLPITSGSTVNNKFAMDVSSLSPGFHTVNVRFVDDRGAWSHFTSRSFFVMSSNATSASSITALEYFIDADPDITSGLDGTGTPVTPAAMIDENIFIDVTGISPGPHTIYIRAKDDKGFWSTAQRADFTILNCTPPAPPLATSASRCGAGTVKLDASGAIGSQIYRWYDDETSGTILQTGMSFTTPALTATRKYFVSLYDPGTTCESGRVEVTATINSITKPLVNPSGDISFCEGGFVVLSAPTGFAQYKWSTGETTRQIFVDAFGEYTVQVSDGVCDSPLSDPVRITVIAAPPKPTITISGTTTICGSGSVQLTGPAGFNYVWSNGAATQSVTVSQSEVLYLRVRSSENCLSEPSDPVVVTVQTTPCGENSGGNNGGGSNGGGNGGNGNNQSPTINSIPLSSPIEGQVTLDLVEIVNDADNNLDFTSLRLLSNTTARGGKASIDGSYNLIVNYEGLPFTGTDRITLEVCDLAGACVQQVLDIEVVGAVVVYNGVTPDGDGKNDFFLLKYIDVVEGAESNKVTIFNRWGDIVFNTINYNNSDRVFTGVSNNGSDLPSGTYFYKVEFEGRIKPLTGFLTLKR